jgi:type II secretory pathway pseudopilin PulG
MKPASHLNSHHSLRLFGIKLKRRKSARAYSVGGFTLIELIVAGAISVIVILVAWSGLVSAMNISQVAQARVERQTELNRALDFMTNEIRMARSINQSSTLTANGTNVQLSDVVRSAGVSLANLGNYGTLGLYLEQPIANAPAICPMGGPSAGVAPPAPADFDPIVYDIRPSSNGWLQPQMVARYGRVPLADGTIDPCSSPVSSDPMMDAISSTMSQTPTCTGTLSGSGGFYSCVNGKEANLFLQSDVTKAEVRQVTSTIASRVFDIQPITASATSCSIEGTLRSVSTSPASTIEFLNKTANTIKIYWIDYSGARQYYVDLPPNQSATEQSYDTHPWVVTDAGGNCLDVFVAGKTASLATVQ